MAGRHWASLVFFFFFCLSGRRLRLRLSPSAFSFGFLLRLSPSAFCFGFIVAFVFAFVWFRPSMGLLVHPHLVFVAIMFAIKMALMLSSSWSSRHPFILFHACSSSCSTHPLHHACPWCDVPDRCAVDLCLWAQEISGRVPVVSVCFPGVGLHRSAELARPRVSESWSPVGPVSTIQYISTPQYVVFGGRVGCTGL